MMTAEFLLRIYHHGPNSYNYALHKRRKFLWWSYWDWFASTWKVKLAVYYMEEAGMTNENTQVQRLGAP